MSNLRLFWLDSLEKQASLIFRLLRNNLFTASKDTDHGSMSVYGHGHKLRRGIFRDAIQYFVCGDII